MVPATKRTNRDCRSPQQTAMKKSLRQGGAADLNVYTVGNM